MEYQSLLDQQASSLQLSLTPLARMYYHSSSTKIECCGGVVVKIVSESSADSTISLRDSSGDCFCAVHGDITNAYPDVLTPGALLLIHNATLLVTSNKMPPLLILCLHNLVGLMLPEDVPNEDDSHQTCPPPSLQPEQQSIQQLPSPAFSLRSAASRTCSMQIRDGGYQDDDAAAHNPVSVATPVTPASPQELGIAAGSGRLSGLSQLHIPFEHVIATPSAPLLPDGPSTSSYRSHASVNTAATVNDTPSVRHDTRNDTDAIVTVSHASSYPSHRTPQSTQTAYLQHSRYHANQSGVSNTSNLGALPVNMPPNDKNARAVVRAPMNDDDDDDADCLELADDM